MKILVTGGAGFIGSNLVDKLIELENYVVSVDNLNDFYNPEIKINNFKNQLSNKYFCFEEGNICDKEFIENLFVKHNPDCIIHLAANAGVLPSILNVEKYLENNINGTLQLLEFSKKNKLKKFIFASSSSVYGICKNIPFTETEALLSPISPYAVSKISGESLCYTYSHLYNIKIVVLRFFTVYGQRQRPDLAISKFFKKILNNEEIILNGNGESARDYTYIDDIVAGIISSLNFNNEDYEIFNLGNSNPIKLIDLLKSIENVTGLKSKYRFGNWQKGDVPITYANIRKAQKILNYKPNIYLDEGLSRMFTWYKNNYNMNSSC